MIWCTKERTDELPRTYTYICVYDTHIYLQIQTPINISLIKEQTEHNVGEVCISSLGCMMHRERERERVRDLPSSKTCFKQQPTLYWSIFSIFHWVFFNRYFSMGICQWHRKKQRCNVWKLTNWKGQRPARLLRPPCEKKKMLLYGKSVAPTQTQLWEKNEERCVSVQVYVFFRSGGWGGSFLFYALECWWTVFRPIPIFSPQNVENRKFWAAI